MWVNPPAGPSLLPGFCPLPHSADSILNMWRTLFILLWLPLSACTFMDGDSRVLVTSQPAGAEILIAGSPTGYWTPHFVDLGAFLASDHVITIRKPGYEPESRKVYQYSTAYTSRWIDGGDTDTFLSSPLFWTLGDTLMPFAIHWQYVPHEVFVTLYPDGEAPVHMAPVPVAPNSND